MTLIFQGVDELPAAHGVRVVHLSDLHLGKGREPDEFETFDAVLQVLDTIGPDVIVVSGDLVHVPDDVVALEWVRDRLTEVDSAVVVVPGNHDIANPDRPEAFTRHFGEFPRYETHAGVGFALFDSFGGLRFDEREDWEHEDCAQIGHFSLGKVSEDQFETLAGEVSEPWIAVVHHHLHPGPDDPKSMQPLLDANAFLAWCASFECKAILHGHKHAYAAVRLDGEIPIFRGGATTKLPAVFRVLDVSDTIEWHEIELRDDPGN